MAGYLVLLAFVLVGLIGGVGAGLLARRKGRRLAFVVLLGAAAWLGWTLAWYEVGCSPHSEDCAAALVGVVAGAFGLAALLAWLVGIVVVTAGRHFRARAR